MVNVFYLACIRHVLCKISRLIPTNNSVGQWWCNSGETRHSGRLVEACFKTVRPKKLVLFLTVSIDLMNRLKQRLILQNQHIKLSG